MVFVKVITDGKCFTDWVTGLSDLLRATSPGRSGNSTSDSSVLHYHEIATSFTSCARQMSDWQIDILKEYVSFSKQVLLTWAVISFRCLCGSGNSSPKHRATWYLGSGRPWWAKAWSSGKRERAVKKVFVDGWAPNGGPWSTVREGKVNLRRGWEKSGERPEVRRRNWEETVFGDFSAFLLGKFMITLPFFCLPCLINHFRCTNLDDFQ